MAGRGITTPEDAVAFMNPSLEQDWLDPDLISGIEEVADSLEDAIKKRKNVVVFGDFDVDGITASAVLTRALRALGGKATPFIPHRFEEGYGITAACLDRLLLLSPELIVTVDCGIACKDEVARIVESGISVLITDHHEASDSVPVGVPVADPKLEEGCPSSILAGVGVALKLVQILGMRFGFPHLWKSYTDFGMLGTVADLMPMVSENRALVADGLNRLNTSPRPCLAALLDATKTSLPIDSTNISFSLVPRLNAAGRMGNADLALDLLMTDSYADAFVLAHKLEDLNNQRRDIESQLSEQALEKAAEVYSGQRVLIVAGHNWHEGVKGIVASRLVNRYGVPTLLFTIDGDEARGSGRSAGSVNLFDAIES
ncbi:MAG: DHH family phosphoesterase, partial [Eggerthellaceae bacterium]|nr:DHH family phosphoesterase [Eggerthellaceae bacterium]